MLAHWGKDLTSRWKKSIGIGHNFWKKSCLQHNKVMAIEIKNKREQKYWLWIVCVFFFVCICVCVRMCVCACVRVCDTPYELLNASFLRPTACKHCLHIALSFIMFRSFSEWGHYLPRKHLNFHTHIFLLHIFPFILCFFPAFVLVDLCGLLCDTLQIILKKGFMCMQYKIMEHYALKALDLI